MSPGTAGATPDAFVPRLLSFAEVRAACGAGRCHLLLGNGFSIACDPIFRYASLYDSAVAAGLSDRAQQVFQRLGTNNFEGVLQLLDDSRWVATLYEIPVNDTLGMAQDSAVVKHTLVEAVTTSHLAHTGLVLDAKKTAARAFLAAFHNVFTTNYDLLLYWAVLHGGEPTHQDGFRPSEEEPDAPYLVFSERLGETKGIYYLHGALHFYLAGGELRKHSWVRTDRRLTDSIREGLAAGQYPLFVAEGDPEKKLQQIQRNGYLWYALEKFRRIEGPLVIYGHSLGPSDQHLVDAIAENRKMRTVYIGLHGSTTSEANLRVQQAVARMQSRRNEFARGRRSCPELEVAYFDSTTANAWG